MVVNLQPAMAMVGDLGHTYALAARDRTEATAAAIASAFQHHHARNEFYRAQCDAACIKPSDITDYEALRLIPLLPVTMFKQPNAHVLLSTTLDDIELEIRSTGTGGIPSVARRDQRTVTRIVLALNATYREFVPISNGAGLMLCPSTAEIPEMGMVKVFNVFCGLLDDHRYVVRDYAFNPGEALDLLQEWEGTMTRHLFGPPFLINRLLRYLEFEDQTCQLDPDTYVVTLGGWKRYTGESMSRKDFDTCIQRYLGVRPDRIRDTYGMIESNMLAVECEHHNKHVPPWCYVSIRDVSDTSVELPAGRTGLIAILDALNTAYPGFLLSQDVGEVSSDQCPCGRGGQVVTFRRRAQGAELGCCAVSIERFIDTRDVVATCASSPS